MSHFVQHSHFTQLGDRFKITVYSQITTCVISISGRLQGANGHLANFEHRVTVSATGLQTVYRPASGEWWIMSCVASVVSGTVNPGDVLVKVELVQGDPTNTVPHDTLIVGSPDSFIPVTMGSPGEFSVDGRRSRTRFVTQSNPAVNAAQDFTVPSGVMWRPLAGYFTLATQAASSANGYLALYTESFDVLYDGRSSVVLGASETGVCTFAIGGGSYGGAVQKYFQFSPPSVLLYPGYVVEYSYDTKTGSVQVGSTTLTVEETILG